jgi:hypothetical protein
METIFILSFFAIFVALSVVAIWDVWHNHRLSKEADGIFIV